MLELIGEGDLGKVPLSFPPFLLGAIWLNMIKKDRERIKKKRAEEGWSPEVPFNFFYQAS